MDVGFDEWASWSPCTATCGLEASKIRKRECLEEFCLGSNIMMESCEYPPCPSKSYENVLYFDEQTKVMMNCLNFVIRNAFKKSAVAGVKMLTHFKL